MSKWRTLATPQIRSLSLFLSRIVYLNFHLRRYSPFEMSNNKMKIFYDWFALSSAV